MFIKSDIRKVTIALEKAFSRKVYLRLGKEAIIHLSRLHAGDALTDVGILAEEGITRDIVAESIFALNALQIESGETFVSEKMRDADKDAAFVSKAKMTMERLQRLRSKIQEEMVSLTERVEYVAALSRMGIDPEAMKKARLLRVVFGYVEDIVPDLPAEGPFVVAATDRYVFGAAMPHAVPRMLQFLQGYGFIDKTADISGASLEDLKGRADTLMRRLDILDRYTDTLRKEIGPALLQLYHSYKGHEEVLKVMRLSLFSAKTVFITGWMDARDKQRLVATLRDVCGERFVISDERDPKAPVRLMNIPLFKPFELIVKTMGMPANNEIDPTPLAAVTFVVIFGLMFGDLGQGLVLAMTGMFLRGIARKKGQENIVSAGGILIACGLSAAFCGALYGSLFSSEHLIPALWIRPSRNIMDLFTFTILLGAVVIVIGFCVNIINSFIAADYVEALLEKRGLATLILYVAIVLLTIRYASLRQAPALWEIIAFVVLPLVVFSLRGVLGPVLFKKSRPHDIAEYMIETVMEVMEIALSMFANTVSFIRVGAFALSHAGLSIVTYALAGMVDSTLKSPVAIAVLVFGNIFIIGFEGLICGIQSMRLEYYEFFSKFFRGDGVVFSPFILKVRMSEV